MSYLHPVSTHWRRGAWQCRVFDQVRVALALGNRLELVGHRLLQEAAHPHDALEAAIGGDELGADQVELADAHHARCLQAAAGHARQRAEGHARRSHAGVLAADHHHAVGFGMSMTMHSKQPQAVIGFSMMEYMATSSTTPCEPTLA
jgi:hypothetical protein